MSLPLNLDHGGDQMGGMNHEGGHNGMMHHGGGHNGAMHHGGGHHAVQQQFIVATGYLALGFIALTLLIGPANLLLRRRTPVSNYLSRDVGTWAVIASVVHTIFVLLAPGSGRIRDVLAFFFLAPGGGPLLNSFALGNWTGLAALVIVVGLLAISSDVALGKLKAGTWKHLQRLNYALFALVILHAFFYGALLRVTSPFTLLLGVSIVAVFAGQAVGVSLWRRKYASTTAG
jgi:sulfoxide reductase heme-binding subunit YedZ